MEAIYCACMLSNLEGLQNSSSIKEQFLVSTLTALDMRTQKLEGATSGLLAPPPTTPLTWSALAWRVARVSANTRRFSTILQSAPEVPLSASPELLDSIVEALNAKAPGTVPAPTGTRGGTAADEGDGDDEKTVCDDKDSDERRLSIIRQRLCFAVGKRGKKIDRIPYDLAGTCSLALYLSLEVENKVPVVPHPPLRGMHTGTVPLPGPPPPRMVTTIKQCKCRCPNRRGLKRVSIGDRIGGFFRKLAWWKKKDGSESDSDADSFCGSDTTSSSGTSIVDH